MVVCQSIRRAWHAALMLTLLLLLAEPSAAASVEPRFMAVDSVWGIWRTAGPFRKAECEEFNNVMREAVRLTLAQMDPPVVLALVVPGLYAGGREGLFIIHCVEIVQKVTPSNTRQ
jgi:hypothetical protein